MSGHTDVAVDVTSLVYDALQIDAIWDVGRSQPGQACRAEFRRVPDAQQLLADRGVPGRHAVPPDGQPQQGTQLRPGTVQRVAAEESE